MKFGQLMACIVRVDLPAEEFVLHEGMSSLPDVKFSVERIVQSGEQAVMPLMWVHGADHNTVEAAFASDPSIQDHSLLADFDTEQLYRMEWISEVDVVLQMLTNSEATITDAYGTDDLWTLRVLFPSRKLVQKTLDFCGNAGLRIDIQTLRELEGKPAGLYGLSDEQFEALRVAVAEGFFEIPRGVSQEELADKLGISHQAASERIRRGMRTLIDDTISFGKLEDHQPRL